MHRSEHSRCLLPRIRSISSAVVAVLIVSAFCSVAVLLLTDVADEPTNRLPACLEPISRLLNSALAAFDRTLGLDENLSRSLQLYRLVVAMCFVIATCFFVASQSRWMEWGASVGRVLVASGHVRQDSLAKPALFGFRQMILGLFGVTFLLIWDEYTFGPSGSLLFSDRWTFLRVPVLTSLAFASACYAAAFRSCYKKK